MGSKDRQAIPTLGEEYDTILTADLSADQSLVAIGGPSKVVKVFDLASGEILYQIKKHSEWVTQVQFSPDGILLATGDRNGGLHVWEARTGNAFYTLDGHKKSHHRLKLAGRLERFVVRFRGCLRTDLGNDQRQAGRHLERSWDRNPFGSL